jgi:SAM-dependent methyltransferase
MARTEIIRDTIRMHVPCCERLLEVGCGTGTNLPMLEQFGHTEACEPDEALRQVARQRGHNVMPSALPELAGVPLAHYDSVFAFDVLEHCADDSEAIRAMAERVRPGGNLVVTVPALPWLWGPHDEANGHYRRYTAKSLRKVASAAGFRVVFISYFNFLLLPVAIVRRLFQRVLKKDGPDNALPSNIMNRLLYHVFASERHLCTRFRVPIGLSLIAVMKATK